MSFLNTPSMRPYGDEEWILCEPLIYCTSEDDVICAPVGFIHNLASIPQAFQWLLPVNDRHKLAAVLHDYLYTVQPVSRARADALFLEAMESLGVSWWKRNAMYAGVRAGGWVAWDRNAEQLNARRAAFLAESGIQEK